MSLKDNPLLKGCRVKIPNLDLFDEKVTMLKNIQQEIQKIQTPKQIFWLRIDLKPMMTNLESKVIQWIKVYTDFLVHQFKTTLKNLQEFIAVTNEGVANNPSAEENRDNRDLLMNVMQVISQVNDIGQIEWLIQRQKDIVLKLKKHNVILQEKGGEDPLQQIDNVNSSFKEMESKVFSVKADIIQLQVKESVNIKNNIDLFNKKVVAFREEFLKTLPFDYDDKLGMEEINDK